MRKFFGLIKKIWKDSVGGNLISTLILALISVFYNFFKALISDKDFVTTLIEFWNYKIKLWQVVFGVLIILIVVKLIQKTRNNNSKFKYENDTFELDRQLYKKITGNFLTQDLVLDLRNQTFSSNSFPIDKTDWIHYILEETKKSDFEFYHPDIEDLKNKLIAEIVKFHSVLGSNIFGAGQSGWVGIPREWKRDRFYDAANKISDCEKAICQSYDNLVKACRIILKV